MNPAALTLGARLTPEGRTAFRVWAPKAESVEVRVVAPHERLIVLVPEPRGYHFAEVEDVPAGSDYWYRLDGATERPDPASGWQPHGVHGPSRVVAPGFEWTDGDWRGLDWRRAVLYELHVGTFTPEGTLAAAAARLPELRQLGITAVELMPVAQFPGDRNWGYDGVFPFAVQDSYGGPAGLKHFVEAAHALGLGVILDVVYNHLGPEGNYLAEFGHYFTGRYQTPWGAALNFDGPHSDEVRRYFLENALQWQTEYHLDALRLDAVHAIRDFSAVPFLEELGEVTRRQAETLGRRFQLVAESDMNMARHILPRNLGGYGLDAQWSDDFHHALQVLLTGERDGYYADYGGVGWLARAWREGYAYTGDYSVHRRQRHGSSPRLNPVKQFVVCAQNHDQVGNRMLGERHGATLSPGDLRLAAATLLWSPFVPLLFMGEEYGERAPFQYFVSHSDPALVAAVRQGRRKEFAAFAWQGEVPDPQDEATFQRSKLDWGLQAEPAHGQLREFYRECLHARAGLAALAGAEKETMEVCAWEREQVLLACYRAPRQRVAVLLHFGSEPVELDLPLGAGLWRRVLDSQSTRWGGDSSWPDQLTSGGSVRRQWGPRQALLLCGEETTVS